MMNAILKEAFSDSPTWFYHVFPGTGARELRRSEEKETKATKEHPHFVQGSKTLVFLMHDYNESLLELYLMIPNTTIS